MLNAITTVLGSVGGLATTFLEGRQEVARNKALVAKAKAEAEAKVLVSSATSTAEWEKVMAQNSGDSWKDEAWTLTFIGILLANFIPFTQPYIEQGFIALSKCPDWFTYAMFLSISASFGIRGVSKFMKGK